MAAHDATLGTLVKVVDQDGYSGDVKSTGEPDASKAMGIEIQTGFAAVGTLHHKVGIKAKTDDSSITYVSLALLTTLGGVILPSLTTTQRGNLPTPALGTVIYNSTTNKLNVYTGSWEAVTSA